MCYFLGVLAFGGGYAAQSAITYNNLVFLLTLIILPIINGIFDWLSYGFTMFLLVKGKDKKKLWPFVFGFLDVLAAFVLFAALATTFVVLFAQINLWRGWQVIDVRGILDHPDQHIWVIVMIASTLLPTLLHLLLALWSMITWMPSHYWRGLVDGLTPAGSHVVPLTSAGVLSACLMFFYLAPVAGAIGVSWGLWQVSGGLLTRYVTWLHMVLDWMGQPVLSPVAI